MYCLRRKSISQTAPNFAFAKGSYRVRETESCTAQRPGCSTLFRPAKNFRRKPNVHSYYPRMCGFIGNPYCHLLVAIAWVGPRRVDRLGRKYECHHLNGDNTDSRASNLIWLSKAEHLRFDAALRQGLVLERQDPDARMEYEMTHHMEI